MSLNVKKYSHLLLVAVLCYSQMAASIHLVGHLHDYTLPDGAVSAPHHSAHSSHSDHAGHNHGQILVVHSFASGKPPVATDQPESLTDANCALYHALSSLNGLFFPAGATADAPVTVSEKESCHLNPASVFALENQPIRAPPTFS